MGDFNTSLTPVDRSSKLNINKETEALNDTIDQIDLIYRTLHPKTADYTFFSMCTEHSPGQITLWVINQASVNLRKLKSYQASFLTKTL